jgi:hypothetical protein
MWHPQENSCQGAHSQARSTEVCKGRRHSACSTASYPVQRPLPPPPPPHTQPPIGAWQVAPASPIFSCRLVPAPTPSPLPPMPLGITLTLRSSSAAPRPTPGCAAATPPATAAPRVPLASAARAKASPPSPGAQSSSSTCSCVCGGGGRGRGGGIVSAYRGVGVSGAGRPAAPAAASCGPCRMG